MADASPESCVELFHTDQHSTASSETSPFKWLQAEFNISKTNWFLAPELREPLASETILQGRMEQVYAFEKIRIHAAATGSRLSRMGESGGEVTGFHQVPDTSKYSYAKPPWTDTTAKVFEFEPNLTPQEDRTLGNWKGRIYLSAGDLILREPKMAEENVDAKVFFFEKEKLKRVLSFSEFFIQRLPDESVAIFRAMSKHEKTLWAQKDVDGLVREGQRRLDSGLAHSRFKRPGFYFSLAVRSSPKT